MAPDKLNQTNHVKLCFNLIISQTLNRLLLVFNFPHSFNQGSMPQPNYPCIHETIDVYQGIVHSPIKRGLTFLPSK